MLFQEYFDKACAICIVDDGDIWDSYLLPDYKVRLFQAALAPEMVSDYELNMDELTEMLKLEVERRRIVTGRSRAMIEWLYNLLTEEIDPLKEELDSTMVNDMVEYMKLKGVLSDKDIELQQREKTVSAKENAQQKLTRMINFSMKENIVN